MAYHMVLIGPGIFINNLLVLKTLAAKSKGSYQSARLCRLCLDLEIHFHGYCLSFKARFHVELRTSINIFGTPNFTLRLTVK